MIKIGLIGKGKWGINYLKTLTQLPGISVIVAGKDNWEDILGQVDGVIIATPPSSHLTILEVCNIYQLPVLLEKPAVLCISDLNILANYSVPILVNYIHLFSNFYQYIKQSIDISQIQSIISVGCNLGPQREYSSLWDYGVHDLAMILDLMEVKPNYWSITSESSNLGELFDIRLLFDSTVSYSLVGNGAPDKGRNLYLKNQDTIIGYDDITKQILGLPAIETTTSPLFNVIQVFLRIIKGKEDKRAGLQLTNKITRILGNNLI